MRSILPFVVSGLVGGSSYALLTSTGSGDGIVAVYVDGKHVRDVSLYSKATHTFVGGNLRYDELVVRVLQCHGLRRGHGEDGGIDGGDLHGAADATTGARLALWRP